jgi:ABC-type branched-subunit amino acid transport system permease subunit
MDVSGLLFILDGVVLGAILSLIAVGLTLIYGLADVLNLSHGEILVAGTVAASVLEVGALLVGVNVRRYRLLVFVLAPYSWHWPHN